MKHRNKWLERESSSDRSRDITSPLTTPEILPILPLPPSGALYKNTNRTVALRTGLSPGWGWWGVGGGANFSSLFPHE